MLHLRTFQSEFVMQWCQNCLIIKPDMFYISSKKSSNQNRKKYSVHSEICLYCRFKNSRLHVDLSASLPSLAAMCHCCIFTRLIRRASAASLIVEHNSFLASQDQGWVYRIEKLSNADISRLSEYRRVYRFKPPIWSISIFSKPVI